MSQDSMTAEPFETAARMRSLTNPHKGHASIVHCL